VKRSIAALILFAFVACRLFSQGGEALGEGFGLQASIFTITRSVSQDLNRNFSDASAYNLTPGDIFTLVLSAGIGFDATGGGKAATYSIQLQEDYTLDVPVLGRIDASGKRIPELQRQISERLEKALALQHVSFTLSAPAQFNVFIYGNVQKPGFVVLTPMHRLIDAIAASGGFKSNGSYRSIKLERDGVTSEYDISRFYGRADLSSNPYLKPGDTIFVPDAEIATTVTGLVQFPGVYELVPGETLATLLNLAGGTLPGARTDHVEIRRINDSGALTRLSVSLEDGSETSIHPGDQVVVRSVSENVKRITVEGAVYGSRLSGESPVQIPNAPVRIDFPYYPGITLLDVLDEVGGPTPRAVIEDSYLRRGTTGEILGLEIEKLWQSREEDSNVRLMPGDYILIPIQRTEVFVSGAVNGPGAVPYRPGYSVSDYLLLSGGIHPNRGNPDRIFIVNELGQMAPTELHARIKPGAHIHVDEKWLFSADQTAQNFFITTAWVTTVVATVTTVLDFIFTYVVQNSATTAR
jgi:polysaccharide biosynthesis/export protein